MKKRKYDLGKRALAYILSAGMVITAMTPGTIAVSAAQEEEPDYETGDETLSAGLSDAEGERDSAVGDDILNFKQANIYNVESNFKDGKITGAYTNGSLSLPVTVYKAGIRTYFPGDDISEDNQYGISPNKGKALFSVDLPEGKAKYTFTVGAGTGSENANLYSDLAVSAPLFETDVKVGGDLVYKKSSNDAQTVYFAVTGSNNFYCTGVAIKKEELAEETKVLYKNEVTGIESSDSDVVITFKGQTETLTKSAADYSSEGVSLITGETYEITATGKKAVYSGGSITAEENGESLLVLNRVIMDLPLMITDDFDDIDLYLNNMGYASDKDVTDAYSGMVIYGNGMNLSKGLASYGAKSNGDTLISFKAKKTGTATVNVYITAIGDSGEKLGLAVNGKAVGEEQDVNAANSTCSLTADVTAGDTVTITTSTHSNLYYNSISASYEGDGWNISNASDGGSGTAEYSGMGLVYHSNSSEIEVKVSGTMKGVQCKSSDGKASGGIVTTSGGVSYVDFTAPSDGTLTVYVGNAGSKTGYVSTATEAIASYVPGGTGDYDAEGFTVVQGTNYATLNIETEKDETYYINVSESKMICYGGAFTPYTTLSGKVTIDGSDATEDCGIKFMNKNEDMIFTTVAKNGSYSLNLKPGSYSVCPAGDAAAKYVMSSTGATTVTVQSGTTAEPASQTFDVALAGAEYITASGKLTGFDTTPSDLKLLFVPSDKNRYVTAEATITGKAYTVSLVKGVTYNVSFTGAAEYSLSEAVEVAAGASDVTQDIAFTGKDRYQVTGAFMILPDDGGDMTAQDPGVNTVTFTNIDDDAEYTADVTGGSYSLMLRDGSYVASITSDTYSTATTVTVSGKAVERDILLKPKKKSSSAATYRDILYVGSDKDYKTVQAAVNAAAAMGNRTEDKRVTIMISPGTYREQVVINTPYITLASDGGSSDDTKITWYYGIGYKYYSSVNSYYDPYAAYDKNEKGDVVNYWGAAVITEAKAEGFRAENICFENSFNKYVTEEEIADGAEPNGRVAIDIERTMDLAADSKAATERAAALVNYADRTEFYKCSFIGSQDTLYTCNRPYDAYYKDCYIEGQTDFIYGNGDVIFDGCEICFCGYSEKAVGGYITANKSETNYVASDGYIFNSCSVVYDKNRKVTAGYLGRMWGDHCTVAFINTRFEEPDMIVASGWENMNAQVTSDDVTLVEYNSTSGGTAIDTSGRTKGVVDSIDEDSYSVQGVFIDNGWTPYYYGDVGKDDSSSSKAGLTSSSERSVDSSSEREWSSSSEKQSPASSSEGADNSSSAKTEDSTSTKTGDSTTTKTGDSTSTKTEESTSTKTGDSTTTKTEDSTSTKTEDSTTTKTEDSTTAKTEDSTTAKTEDSTTAKTEDSTTAKTEDSTTAKADDSTTAKTEDSTTAKTDDSTTAKTEDSTTAKTEDSTTAKTEDSTTAKTEDSTTAKTGDSTTAKTDATSSAKSDSSTTAKNEASSTAKNTERSSAKAAPSGGSDLPKERQEELARKGNEGYGSETDSVPVTASGAKNTYQITISENAVRSTVTLAAGGKTAIVISGGEATDFVCNTPGVKISKKGILKIKKGFDGEAVITYMQNGVQKELVIKVIEPAIDTLGDSTLTNKKLNVTASPGQEGEIHFALKAPLNTVFDTASNKFKNKGVIDASYLSIVPGSGDRWFVSCKALDKGKVTIPFEVNGKKYKLKINVKM